MKRLVVLSLCAFFFCGCSAVQTMETVADDIQVMASPATVEITYFNEDVSAITADGGDRLYFCDGYTVAVQILNSVNLENSIRMMTGYSSDDLTVMKTSRDGLPAYEYVWTAAGESQEQMCRGILLDDGMFHYAITVMADYSQAGELQQTWQELLNSVSINTD